MRSHAYAQGPRIFWSRDQGESGTIFGPVPYAGVPRFLNNLRLEIRPFIGGLLQTRPILNLGWVNCEVSVIIKKK